MEDIEDDEHMAVKELPKLSRAMNSSVLDSFRNLSANVEKHRIAAAISLLKHLHEKQLVNQSEGSSKELTYALTRLVRGVGSSRINNRTGFFSALVGLLATFSTLKVNDVLAVVRKELQITSNISKGEEAEIYMAQILVCGAMIHSDRLLAASPDERREVLTMIVEAGKKRSYLPLTVCSFLIDLVNKVDETWFREALWPVVKNEVRRPWSEQTLDTLYILLLVRERFPSVVKGKGLAKTLGTPDVLHADSLQPLGQLLVNVPAVATLQHPVYKELCRRLAASDLLLPFWECVDAQMAKANRCKELAVLEILRIVLSHIVDKTKIPKLLSPLLMEQLRKTLASSDSKGEVVNSARQTFSLLAKGVESEEVSDKTRLSVLKKLLFHPGDISFEKYTGTKVVHQVTSQLKADGVRKLAHTYRSVILAKKPKVKRQDDKPIFWNSRDRLSAAHMFSRLLTHQAMQEDVAWKEEQLQFLIAVGFLAPPPGEDTESTVRMALASGVKECFFRTLDQRLPRLDMLRSLLGSTVRHIHLLLFGPQPAPLRQPLTPSAEQAWRRMMAEVEGLETQVIKKKKKKASSLAVFHTLFLHMGLQLFQDSDLAMESLQELHHCYARAVSRKTTKAPGEEDDEPHWVEVAVDLFLSLLSRDSHLLRSLVGCVFPHLCQHLTPSAIHQILQVLDPNSKRNPLMGKGAEADADESEGDDLSDDPDKSESEQEMEEGDEDSDSDFSDVDAEDEPINLQLKQAVRQALGTAADTDMESVDMDNMDEDEGRRLDMALSEAFKLLRTSRSDKKGKKQSKDDKVLTHFRVRVLDLLDMYLGAEPAMALCLDMLLPLFELLEFCVKDQHQKPLEMRVRACLKKLSSVKHFSSTSGVDQDLLADVLSRLLDRGQCTAPVFLDMSNSVALCCTFLVRCSQQLVKLEGVDRIVDTYKTALLSFFKKRDSLLQQNMFRCVLQLSWSGAWVLVPVLTELTFDPDIRPFRRNQALDLLTVFFRNHRLLASADPAQRQILINVEKQLSQETIKVLTVLCKANETKASVPQKFVRGLLGLCQVVWQAHRQKGDAGMDWSALWAAVVQYRSKVATTSDMKSTTNRLGKLMGMNINNSTMDIQDVESKLSNGKGKKVVTEETSSSEEEAEDTFNSEEETMIPVTKMSEKEKRKEKKRRQKKKAKTKADLKKQTREYRNDAMSEGIGSGIGFAQVDLLNLKDFEDSDTDGGGESLKPQKKKRKTQGVVNGNGRSSDDEAEFDSMGGSRKKGNKRKHMESKDQLKLTKKKKHKK